MDAGAEEGLPRQMVIAQLMINEFVQSAVRGSEWVRRTPAATGPGTLVAVDGWYFRMVERNLLGSEFVPSGFLGRERCGCISMLPMRPSRRPPPGS